MFDFSFGEIGLIAVVALVVLGPERLPKVARTAGALVRRARTSWQSVKDEIERELEAEDLKRSFSEARQAASELRDEMQRTSVDIEASARAATNPGAAAAETSMPVDGGTLSRPADAEALDAPPAEPHATASGAVVHPAERDPKSTDAPR